MKKIPIRQLAPARQALADNERYKIRRVEDIVGENDMVQDLHRHDFFFILAIEKGKGHHEIDFTSYKVQDNTVFFLRPGQVHELLLKAGSTGYLVEFNTAFYNSQRLRKAGNKNHCTFETRQFGKLGSMLALMFDEYVAAEEGYADIIKSCLDIFFAEFLRRRTGKNKNPVPSYPQERFEEFLELLEKHITTHKQVAQYTNLMNLSSYQLNEITKTAVGKTASELVNEHIILEAKRQLLATTSQVKDIADQLGYEDNSYFIRFFKKHTGVSPEQFRRNFK